MRIGSAVKKLCTVKQPSQADETGGRHLITTKWYVDLRILWVVIEFLI